MKDKMYVKPKDIFKMFYPYKKIGHRKHVNEQQYHNVVSAWSDIALEELIEKGETPLPGKLGKLKIRKVKSKKQPIDWVGFRETGEVSYLDNSHSDGYIVKCSWFDRLYMFSRSLFSFKLTRKASSRLANHVKDNPYAIHNYDTIIN